MVRFCSLSAFLALIAGCAQEQQVSKNNQEKLVALQSKTTKDDVEPIVRIVVADRLKVKPSSLDMKKPIADELDVVQVVMTLEERFMFEIPEAVIEKHSKAKLGEPACKLSPLQLVAIVEESRSLAEKKR
jgi:acyl carrier protein